VVNIVDKYQMFKKKNTVTGASGSKDEANFKDLLYIGRP
jgi:hypothetical protein